MLGALAGSWNAHRGVDRALLLITALFPLISVAVPSGGSTLFTLLALIALYHVREAWSGIGALERRWLWALLALFLLGAVSLFYSTELENGVQRLERLLRLACIGLIYPLLYRRGIAPGPWLLLSLALAALVMGGQAAYEKLVLHQQFADGLYHKIIFGDFAALIAVLLVTALLTVVRGRGLQLLLLAAVVVALYAVLMSATRAAWLFLLAAPLYLLWLHRRRWSLRLQLGLALLPLALVALLAVWQPRAVMAPIHDGISDLQVFMEKPQVGSSWGARLVMWRNALTIAAEHPLLGTGLGDFNHDSLKLIEQGLSFDYVAQFGHAHSIYFDTLATLGGLGLIVLVLALFWFPYRILIRRWHQNPEGWTRFYTLAGLVCVMAFALFGLVEGWLGRNPFINPYVVYLSLFTAAAMAPGKDAGSSVK